MTTYYINGARVTTFNSGSHVFHNTYLNEQQDQIYNAFDYGWSQVNIFGGVTNGAGWATVNGFGVPIIAAYEQATNPTSSYFWRIPLTGHPKFQGGMKILGIRGAFQYSSDPGTGNYGELAIRRYRLLTTPSLTSSTIAGDVATTTYFLLNESTGDNIGANGGVGLEDHTYTVGDADDVHTIDSEYYYEAMYKPGAGTLTADLFGVWILSTYKTTTGWQPTGLP